MKNSIVLLLVVVVLLVAYVGNTEARKRPGKKVKPGVCKYDRKGEEGPCDASTNTKVISLPLKKGDPTTCQPTKTVSKPCTDNSLTKKKKIRGCKYERKVKWTECDSVSQERTKVMKLKDGSNPQCDATRIKKKKCGGSKKKGGHNSKKDA